MTYQPDNQAKTCGTPLWLERNRQQRLAEWAGHRWGANGLHVVTAATPGRYMAHAAKLVASGLTHGVTVTVYPIPDRGSWQNNCASKALVVKQALEAQPHPVLWVDADATFVDVPDPEYLGWHQVNQITCAAHFTNVPPTHPSKRLINSPMLSGTVWFGQTPKTRELVRQWCQWAEARDVGNTLDQDILCRLLQSHEFECGAMTLDPRYVTIFDLMDYVANPVIKHWQASRETR